MGLFLLVGLPDVHQQLGFYAILFLPFSAVVMWPCNQAGVFDNPRVDESPMCVCSVQMCMLVRELSLYYVCIPSSRAMC